MDTECLYFNGIAPSGHYLRRPLTRAELVEQLRTLKLEPPPEWVLDWTREYDVDDPRRKPILMTKRKWDLTETGWGVVFAEGINPRVRTALAELLDLRKKQATKGGKSHYFRECEYRSGESTLAFLERHRVSAGARGNPDRLPYYLLLVGDPEAIPYSFQAELDVSYAVGRICFDQEEDYRAYARSVARAETGRPPRSRKVGFFAPAHEGDPSTQSTMAELVLPLSEPLVTPESRWSVIRALGSEARKERLLSLLGGSETPALLVAACHGLGLPLEDERQREIQGALVCQDWAGPNHAVDEDQWLAAADIPDGASLHGLIALFVACYGVGTPLRDNFDQDPLGKARQIAPQSFASRLPQRLLSHPGGGALAVVGHVDRSWTTSFAGSSEGEGCEPFADFLAYLLEGETIGWAMESLNQTYANLSAQLNTMWQDWRLREKVDNERFSRIWCLCNDARNYMLFGDPAVRLPPVGRKR